MADTIRDEAALQALFADNTTRSISPQKIRDFLVSVPSLASTANLALVGGTMTGDLLFSTDNTRDIGASGATRPRTGYFGTSLIAGSGTSTGKALQAIGGIGTGLSFTHTGSGNSGQRAKFFLTAGISGYSNDGMGLYENYDGADVYHIATANKSLFLGGRYNATNTASVTILNDQAKARALDVLGSIALISAVGTIDTALARNAAGVVEVTNGTAGTYRDLIARNVIINGPDAFTLGGGSAVARVTYLASGSIYQFYTAVDSLASVEVGAVKLPAGRLRARTTTATTPTTAEFGTDMDFGIHRDSATGNVWLAYNDGGTIKKVQLT